MKICTSPTSSQANVRVPTWPATSPASPTWSSLPGCASWGAVLIEGPKACGNTATALQVEPAIWNRVRRQVDDRAARGKFILTGSARPRDDVSRHSGAGRFSLMQMRPMSLFESGPSTGEISLGALLEGETQTGLGTHLTFNDLLGRIIIGGWPELIGADEDFARDRLADYLRQIVEVDAPELGVRRSPGDLRRLTESLGRGVGQAVKLTELLRDVGGDRGPVDGLPLRSAGDARRPDLRAAAPRSGRLLARLQRQQGCRGRDSSRQQAGPLRDQAQPPRRRRGSSLAPPVRSERRHRAPQGACLPRRHHLDRRRRTSFRRRSGRPDRSLRAPAREEPCAGGCWAG